MTTDPKSIAEGLSDAQRRLLEDAFYTNCWRINHQSAGLFVKGLTTTKHGFKLTPLGCAVRSHLVSERMRQ